MTDAEVQVLIRAAAKTLNDAVIRLLQDDPHQWSLSVAIYIVSTIQDHETN